MPAEPTPTQPIFVQTLTRPAQRPAHRLATLGHEPQALSEASSTTKTGNPAVRVHPYGRQWQCLQCLQVFAVLASVCSTCKCLQHSQVFVVLARKQSSGNDSGVVNALQGHCQIPAACTMSILLALASTILAWNALASCRRLHCRALDWLPVPRLLLRCLTDNYAATDRQLPRMLQYY